jgi:hypothetical protein
MKKINLILILILSGQFGFTQSKCQKVTNIDSLFFQNYSLTSKRNNDAWVYTSIDVKTIEYSKILEKFTEPKKFDFRKKSYNVENLEIKGLSEVVNLRIIEGVHRKFIDGEGSTHFCFTIFENQKEKEYALKSTNSNQIVGLCIYIEKNGKNKYLSKEEMDVVIEYLKSI